MVSYYNTPLTYAQKHSAPNLSYPSAPHHQPWFPTQYTPHSHASAAAAAAAANQQFFGGMDHHSQSMYYNPAMFHQSPSDFYARENFQNLSHPQTLPLPPPSTGSSNQHLNSNGSSPLDETSSSAEILTEGIPSPPITTISGSEISSPGLPNASSSPRIPHNNLQQQQRTNLNNNINNNANNNNNNNNNSEDRPSPSNSPYYDWMRKPAYSTQPNPGKTRTKDKYRVVYTDYQRLELEKEYCTSRYITIRRKTELAQNLQLSERQVKIWFQNRRAKERKQTKKRDDPTTSTSSPVTSGSSISILSSPNGQILNPNEEFINFMDTKPKLEHLQHHQHPAFHHQMAAMGMSSMAAAAAAGLHSHHLHHGHHLAAAAAAVSGSPPTSSAPTHHHMNPQASYQLANVIESIS